MRFILCYIGESNKVARIPDFVGESKFTKDINSLIQSTADNNVSILALGEKGTGKKLFAMSQLLSKILLLKIIFI